MNLSNSSPNPAHRRFEFKVRQMDLSKEFSEREGAKRPYTYLGSTDDNKIPQEEKEHWYAFFRDAVINMNRRSKTSKIF